MTTLLTNHWYLAAWSKEVGSQPFRRKICNLPVVLFRTQQGQIQALRDVCPHRFAPLSMGHIEGDAIVCPYHGLRFNGEGVCTHSPFGQPPAGAKVRALPVVERDGGIWLWTGHPAAARLEDVPDYSGYLFKPELDCIRMHVLLESHIMLGVENLLDLTHAAALHRTSFQMGEYNNFLASEHRAYFEGDELHACWDIRFHEGKGLNTARTTWIAPGRMTISSTVDDRGRDLDPPWLQLHIYTPETETTTHYFTAERFDPSFEPAEHAEQRSRQLLEIVFEPEDNRVLKAIQEEMGDRDFWALKPALLATDKACVLARRRYDQLLRVEREAAASERRASECVQVEQAP